MLKTNLVRQYFKENPSATNAQVAESLGLDPATVRTYITRDLEAGRARRVKGDDGAELIDYSRYFASVDTKDETVKWVREIRMQLIEQLIEANKNITDPDTLRLNAKMIDALLQKV